MSELSGRASPSKLDIDVRIVRPGFAGQTGHGCPNCPASLGRTKWTWMSELSGRAWPDKMDMNVRIVRPGFAGQNGHSCPFVRLPREPNYRFGKNRFYRQSAPCESPGRADCTNLRHFSVRVFSVKGHGREVPRMRNLLFFFHLAGAN